MKGLYEVTATKARPENGKSCLVYKGYHFARSEAEAIELAQLYITEKYGSIRASFVRETD